MEKGQGYGKPNFIIWVADDQYLESVGCYGAIPSHTPNIDRLAAKRLKYTRACSTSSICTPARSALYTGMYPIKNGAHPNHSGLRENIPNMPGIMRKRGYRSALSGQARRPQASNPAQQCLFLGCNIPADRCDH